MAATEAYWQGVDIVGGRPVRVERSTQLDLIMKDALTGAIVLLAVLLMPALVGLLRWSLGRIRLT